MHHSAVSFQCRLCTVSLLCLVCLTLTHKVVKKHCWLDIAASATVGLLASFGGSFAASTLVAQRSLTCGKLCAACMANFQPKLCWMRNLVAFVS